MIDVLHCLTDYVSFTLPQSGNVDSEDVSYTLSDALYQLDTHSLELFDFQGAVNKYPVSIYPGRRPYKTMERVEEWGLSVMWGGQDTVLYEFSGTGCNWLRDHSALETVIGAFAPRMARMDVAIDISAANTPESVVARMDSQRFKTQGMERTATGTTHYIGSRLSDRYLKIYHYNPPHPRSDLTRLEWTMRRHYAKSLAHYYADHSVSDAAQALINDYRIKGINPVSHEVEKLVIAVDRRENASTLRWLIQQAAPAFKRLVDDGTIDDAEAFLEQHFLPDKKGKRKRAKSS